MLTHLTFDFNFNKSIDNLPPNLIYLKLDRLFSKSIYVLGTKTNKLEELIIHNSNSNLIINNLPSSLKKLFIKHYFNNYVDFLP